MTTPRCRSPRKERETAEVSDMVARVMRSLARRAEGGDIDALEELVNLQGILEAAIDRAAKGLHGEPGNYSWGEIGRWLGITRQAARQRFGE